ncbi:MAG TPA: 2-C-methyl-D-erythritol 4-phosphate cytidylyltransferase [Blastocatellia bacterium]|nr:2-C-methyl-D-erythritol 4-phosphate cytidylyltransferase [Blastocatellia bacterium]
MNIAIIPAAGSGTRFGGQVAKQFLKLNSIPIIFHTLRRFDECNDIQMIVVALPESGIKSFDQELSTYNFQKPIRLVAGGRERSDSILNALHSVAELNPEIVAVHDGVRPFVSPEQISSVINRAKETEAAILALPTTDTIKEVVAGFIERTIDRKRIWRAQTPQAFRFDLLLRANQEARNACLPSDVITDDAFLVERLGVRVAVVEGSPHNIKITTPEDLVVAERLIEQFHST